MTEYRCSNGDYSSDQKANVEKHINKKNKCSENPTLVVVEGEINCEYCKETFTTTPSHKRHLKICKTKKNQEFQLQTAEKTKLLEENAKLFEDLEQIKKKMADFQNEIELIKNLKISNTSTVNNNNNNNNTTVNNTFITVNLRPYDDPKLPDDMDDIYEDAWSKKKSISTYIERIHFNSELPENHNICITNLKTKFVKVYTEQGWITFDRDNFLEMIYKSTCHKMEKWVNAQKSRKAYKDDFYEYFEQVGNDFYVGGNKDELVLLFYNGHQIGMINIKSDKKIYTPPID